VTIRLYDTKAQALRDFVPLVEGQAGIYVCGPTVQSSPHIGHLRSALVYDLWRRWLTYRGFAVTLVRNVTDIDDKILLNAKGEVATPSEGERAAGAAAQGNEEWWALAYRVELEFTRGYQQLGILAPTYEPRATASVDAMQAIITRLIDAGHAYAAADDSGDVYFDTASWPAYGELTRQRPENMEAATDADPRGKRAPQDFALWKGWKTTEPTSASWASPWGVGRPGWHIECSAMSSRYLGPQFDIHGGGLDLRFPHHENEIAQSTAAGDAFANYWVHNGLVNVNGQKMSKSLGNSIFAAEFLSQARPLVVRYYLGSAHYRSTIDYHDGALIEAEAALDRIASFLRRAARGLGGVPSASGENIPVDFAAAMDDDLNVPKALAVLHDTVSTGNRELELADVGESDGGTVLFYMEQVLAMTDVLGINPLSEQWNAVGGSSHEHALGSLIDQLIDARKEARDARQFATADRIRSQLSAAGITVEDSPNGTHWSIEP
jgi:cysteinyl-tRNA synthetase